MRELLHLLGDSWVRGPGKFRSYKALDFPNYRLPYPKFPTYPALGTRGALLRVPFGGASRDLGFKVCFCFLQGRCECQSKEIFVPPEMYLALSLMVAVIVRVDCPRFGV